MFWDNRKTPVNTFFELGSPEQKSMLKELLKSNFSGKHFVEIAESFEHSQVSSGWWRMFINK